MNTITEREYHHFSSTSSEFSGTFHTDEKVDKYQYLIVTHATLPKTWYNLPSDSVLVINESGTDREITFSAGNYNIENLPTVFNTAVNAVTGWTYSCSFPDIHTEVDTGKMTITVTGNSSIQPTMTIPNSYLGELMGFDVDSYSFVGDSLTSANLVNFDLLEEVYIKCPGLTTNRDDLIQELHNGDYTQTQTMVFTNQDILMNAKKIRDIRKPNYKFSLVDRNGVLVDLNGAKWSFTVMLFRVTNIEKVLRQYITLKLRDMLEKEKEQVKKKQDQVQKKQDQVQKKK